MIYRATNIRLPEATLRALKVKAAEEGKSLGQLVREAVEATYGLAARAPEVDPTSDPLSRLVGAWASGIPDGALGHDRDIYGDA